MSLQTSLDSYFKSRGNSKASLIKQDNMLSKNKSKKRSLSLTRSPKPLKSPKTLTKIDNKLKTEDEVICLSSSNDDLTPPEQKSHSISLTSNNDELLVEHIGHCINSPNASTDSSSTIIYSISPRCLQKSPRTPSKAAQSPRSNKKFFSPTKKRVVSNKSPAKRSLAFELEKTQEDFTGRKSLDNNQYSNFQDDKTLFLLSIIDRYLKTDSLRKLLDQESQVLLSNCMHIVEPGMRVVCRLYWRQPGWYRMEQLEQIASDKTIVASPTMIEMLQSLLSNNLITADQSEGVNNMDFDDYVKLLKRPVLQQICKELKLKMQSKQDAVDALRKFSQGSAISNYFTGKISNNSDRVLKILRSKTGHCYKLSDVARSTLYKLYVLMYLGMDYTIIREKRLELILLHDKINKETYPIDKNMALDDASIVFQNKDEFYKYLEAHTTYEKYISSEDAQEKADIVLQAFKSYEEITEEAMTRFKSLPPWLRRFTPGNIYVKIMESGVQELKKFKSDAYYKRSLEILDLLITQITFRQHKKAEWYAEKALILHKHLNMSEQAIYTLLEGFNADLPKEAKDALRPRAKLIANQRNVALDEDLRQTIREHVEHEYVVERDLPAEHVYKQPMDNHKQRGKLKFEAYTNEGRSIVTAEDYCILHYTHNGEYTHGEHWEGRMITTIFHLLFWDIIYAKPLGVVGIFMSHYQRHPLDMYSSDFYINRKTLIDDRLLFIEESTDDMVIEMMQSQWEDRPEYEVSDINRTVLSWSDVCFVSRCLGARALAAVCRRLARHYGYAHSGFPDLTLWNVHTNQIKFVEVKTDADKPSIKQLQWLQYLRDHNIPAGFCYVGANTTRCKARRNDTLS